MVSCNIKLGVVFHVTSLQTNMMHITRDDGVKLHAIIALFYSIDALTSTSVIPQCARNSSVQSSDSIECLFSPIVQSMHTSNKKAYFSFDLIPCRVFLLPWVLANNNENETSDLGFYEAFKNE